MKMIDITIMLLLVLPHHTWLSKNIDMYINNHNWLYDDCTPIATGWWFQPTPLKNDGVRQLGLFIIPN